jgi:hypothetical protein
MPPGSSNLCPAHTKSAFWLQGITIVVTFYSSSFLRLPILVPWYMAMTACRP